MTFINSNDDFDRVFYYQNLLMSYFTGDKSLDEEKYRELRKDLIENPRFSELAPTWLRKCRDLGALWSFAKSVDGQWEPRRQFLREEFEPLLDQLERGGPTKQSSMPGPYDSSAWTGIQTTSQQAKAIATLIPVAQAAIGTLINHLDQPSHNGGPRLDEIDFAIEQLKKLHHALGRLVDAANNGTLKPSIEGGLMSEISRYGRQAAKTLKDDPMPYALSGTVLAIFTACGLPGIGGYLGGIAMAIKKNNKS